MKRPLPPFTIVIPAVAWLCLETWGCVQAFSPGRALRLAMVVCLVITVLLERPAALTLWMFCSLLGALLWFAQAFGAGSNTPGAAIVRAALAFCALANAGYLFFFHRAPADRCKAR